MNGLTVGVAVTPYLQRDWLTLAWQSGVRPVGFALHQEVQGWEPGCWLVVLDPRHSPVPLKFWLKQLTAPLVLVTPHLVAAQTLCSWVPRLSVICQPMRAAAILADLLHMAPTVTSGTLVLKEADICGRTYGGVA